MGDPAKVLAESSREAPEFWATVGVFQLGEDREIRLLAYAGTAQRRAERTKKGVGDPGTIVVEVEFGQRLVVWTGGQARKHDMGRLKERDIADVVDCLRDAYALTDIDTFAAQLISRLRKVLVCNGILFGNCDLHNMRSEFVADHPDASKLSLDQIIANLPRDHQHPYWPYYLKSQDPRATKLSDFMTRRELHSKGFYTELYKPLKGEAEIGCMLVIAPHSHLTYIAAIRDGGDFTERDRVVLNLLRPHFSQAYRNAGALTALREEVSLARRMIESLDHGVIALSQTGAVRFVTAQARRWLEEYFPSHRRTDQLPTLLEDWLKHLSASLGRRDDVPEPMGPLVLERDGRKLIVRPVLERDQTILVLAEQWTSVDPRSLECMGLTRREAEVSAWVSEGKTNAEIGQILGVRPLTVKKHLEHIFEKLGVENRTAAAGLILDQQKRTKSAIFLRTSERPR